MGNLMKITWAVVVYVAGVAALYRARINPQFPVVGVPQQPQIPQHYSAEMNIMGGSRRGTGL